MILGTVVGKVARYSAVTLATITSGCGCCIGGHVMTGDTTIMLQVVRAICEVHVIHGCAVTADTTGCRSDLGGVVLGCMGAEVNSDAVVTLGTVTGCRAGQLGGGAVTDITVVMLGVVGGIDKVHIVDSCTVTACTTGGCGDFGRMVFSVGRPVTGNATVTFATVIDRNGNGTVCSMTSETGVMLLIIDRADEASACGHSRAMTAGTFAVQAEVTGGCVIDIMVSPVTGGVTGGTVTTAGDGRAFQGIGRFVVTAGTAVMNLRIA